MNGPHVLAISAVVSLRKKKGKSLFNLHTHIKLDCEPKSRARISRPHHNKFGGKVRFRRPTPRHIYVTFLQRTPCWWFSSRKTQSFRTPLAADCDWAHLWREFHALLNVCWLPLLNRNIFSKNPALSVICWHQIKVDAVDYPYTSKRFICIQRFPFKWLRDVFICRVSALLCVTFTISWRLFSFVSC